MKQLFKISLIILLTSCQQNKNDYNQLFCEQEIEFIKSEFPANYKFDFNLSDEEQINNIKKTLDLEICNSQNVLNGIFKVSDYEIKVPLIIDWSCTDSSHVNYDETVTGYKKQYSHIFVNEEGEILFNSTPIELDSLKHFIYNHSKEFFHDNNLDRVIYQLVYSNETPKKVKINVFKAIIDGYLIGTSEISKMDFGKNICDLEVNQLNILKQKFKLFFLLKNHNPIPLPPENHSINQ